jgi:hypothetical protein
MSVYHDNNSNVLLCKNILQYDKEIILIIWPKCYYYGYVENYLPNGIGIYCKIKKVSVGNFHNG